MKSCFGRIVCRCIDTLIKISISVMILDSEVKADFIATMPTHTGNENYTSRHILALEFASRSLSTNECAGDVHFEQLLYLFDRKVESGAASRYTGTSYHAPQRKTSLRRETVEYAVDLVGDGYVEVAVYGTRRMFRSGRENIF